MASFRASRILTIGNLPGGSEEGVNRMRQGGRLEGSRGLIGAAAVACCVAPVSAQTSFDKAMEDMGQLYFAESHCSDTLEVVIKNPSLETFYREAVRVKPAAFRDTVSSFEKSLEAGVALSAACTKIFDSFNGPEIFVNAKH
jgi:hypothetical protein